MSTLLEDMLKDKARANAALGERLLEGGEVDAAAGRLYYAMYQSAVHAFSAQHVVPSQVRSGAARWDHASVAHNTYRLRGRRDDRRLYHAVLQLRIQADYFEANVTTAELAPLCGAVEDFVRDLTR